MDDEFVGVVRRRYELGDPQVYPVGDLVFVWAEQESRPMETKILSLVSCQNALFYFQIAFH